jgi:hypothetical protein
MVAKISEGPGLATRLLKRFVEQSPSTFMKPSQWKSEMAS